MTYKIAIQADSLDILNPKKDSSLLICREIQARGHELFFYTPEDLFLENGTVYAHTGKVTLSENTDETPYYKQEQLTAIPLSTFDAVLLRKDPPFDIPYILSTYILERAKEQTLILNDPTSIRNMHGKFFALDYPEYVVPYCLCSQFDAFKNFYDTHQDIIIKPLNAHGGKGIVRIKPNATDLQAQFDDYMAEYNEPFLAQKFIPAATKGDKRIIMFDGEIEAAILRVPADEDSLANISAGGSAQATDITDHERRFCALIKDSLKENNLFFVGVDFLGDYVTEVNVISPGTVLPTNQVYDIHLENAFIDRMEVKIQAHQKQKAA